MHTGSVLLHWHIASSYTSMLWFIAHYKVFCLVRRVTHLIFILKFLLLEHTYSQSAMSSPSEISHSYANSTSPSQKMRNPRSSTSPATASSSRSGKEMYRVNYSQSIHDPDFHAFVRDQIPGLFRWWRIPENRDTWARKQSMQQDIWTRTTSSRSSHRPTPYNRPVPGLASVRISRKPTAARSYEMPTEIMNTKGKGKARAQDEYEYENVKFNEMHQSSLNPPRRQTGNGSYMLQVCSYSSFFLWTSTLTRCATFRIQISMPSSFPILLQKWNRLASCDIFNFLSHVLIRLPI